MLLPNSANIRRQIFLLQTDRTLCIRFILATPLKTRPPSPEGLKSSHEDGSAPGPTFCLCLRLCLYQHHLFKLSLEFLLVSVICRTYTDPAGVQVQIVSPTDRGSFCDHSTSLRQFSLSSATLLHARQSPSGEPQSRSLVSTHLLFHLNPPSHIIINVNKNVPTILLLFSNLVS